MPPRSYKISIFFLRWLFAAQLSSKLTLSLYVWIDCFHHYQCDWTSCYLIWYLIRCIAYSCFIYRAGHKDRWCVCSELFPCHSMTGNVFLLTSNCNTAKFLCNSKPGQKQTANAIRLPGKGLGYTVKMLGCFQQQRFVVARLEWELSSWVAPQSASCVKGGHSVWICFMQQSHHGVR